jgi:hypothetical protein
MKHMLVMGMGLVLVGGMASPAIRPLGLSSTVAAPSASTPCDFDGDGYADLATGVPFEDVRGVKDAGAVQVLYGSATGVSARDQLWHQGKPGIKGALEKGDRFGEVLACGDFDGDGSADLAVGMPYEDVGSVYRAGLVQVLYGGPTKLTARDQIWHQGKPGVPGRNEKNDMFGRALTTGDFDADGYADLVIGVPHEGVGTLGAAGWVVVLRGSPDGLTSAGAQSWRQGQAGLASQPGEGELFGSALATGDVNGDGRADLAIGTDRESDTQPAADDRGSGVHLLFGAPAGLTAEGEQHFLAADLGMWPSSVFKLTFGDFNRDGFDDLVLGSGSTAVLHGHSDGLHPGALPAAGAPGVDALWPVGGGDEGYGEAVAAGDLTGDGNPDLAVGARVVLGTDGGLGTTITDWAVWTTDRRSPVDREPYGDTAILPFTGGGHAWLAVTTVVRPPGPEGAGAVTVLRGTPTGDPSSMTVWTQDSPGIKDAAESGDGFGWCIGGGGGAIA